MKDAPQPSPPSIYAFIAPNAAVALDVAVPIDNAVSPDTRSIKISNNVFTSTAKMLLLKKS